MARFAGVGGVVLAVVVGLSLVVGSPVAGAGLPANTGIEVNDMVADATGKNFIKDTICSGNPTCYTGIEIGGAVLGMVGPTGAAGAAKAAAEAGDAAKAAKAAEAGADASKGEDVISGASCAVSALRSFTAATMVLMADGTREPISQVKVGDRVMSYDPGAGTQSMQTVTATWPHSDTVVTLTLGDGSQVETTASHPWWDVTTRTYTRTDHLAVGDQLLTADGSTLTVAGMSAPQGEQQVYNLTITGPHTYYVGDDTILVHNASPLESCPSAAAASSPSLQLIHSEETLTGPTSNFDYLNSQSTEDLINSLKPGSDSPLLVKPDGTVMDGNTRISILQSRGIDVNSLPRTFFPGIQLPFSDFPF